MSGKSKKKLKTGKSKKNMKQKKGVSLMIAYVLLITIGIALSLLVYGWLKFYVSGEDERQFCPEETRLIIKEYKYDTSAKTLEITVQNKGLFSVKGYSIKVHNRTGATSGFYTLYDHNVTLNPGDEDSSGSPHDVSAYGDLITFVEVQPYITDEDDEVVLCQGTSSVKPSEYMQGYAEGCSDDPDDGNEPPIPSEIYIDGIFKIKDTCNGNMLTEYYCNDSSPTGYSSEEYDCPNDYDHPCFEGACQVFGSQESNLIAWYKLDEDLSSTTVLDSSGNNHHGQINNLAGISRIMGMNGSAFSFDLIDLFNCNYVNISDILLGNSVYSISVWIKPNETLKYISAGIFGDEKNQLFTIPETSSWDRDKILYMSSGDAPIMAGGDYDYYQWQHFVITVENTNDDVPKAIVTFYKNGVELSQSWSQRVFSPGITSTRIGCTYNDAMLNPSDPNFGTIKGQFLGGIDDIRVYNKVLSSGEVNDLYKSYFPQYTYSCVQEDATIYPSCGDGCMSYGGYSVFGNWYNGGSRVYDGDWESWDYAYASGTTGSGSASFYVNYSAPCDVVFTYATWNVRVGSEIKELLIPFACMDYSVPPTCYTCPISVGEMRFKIDSIVDTNDGIETSLAYCYNKYLGWQILGSFDNKNVYDESITWYRKSVL